MANTAAASVAVVAASSTSALRPCLSLLRSSSCRPRPFLSAPILTRTRVPNASHPPTPAISTTSAATSKMAASTEITEQAKTALADEGGSNRRYKKVFVAGATGRMGKRIIELLVAKGFEVRAGSFDMDRARGCLPSDVKVQIVREDVTEGPEKLMEAIGDADAVVCATGFWCSWDIFTPWKVDNFGTMNLVEACRKAGVNRFILISSILVNGSAIGQIFNPAYVILNVFGLTLIAKLQVEKYIRRSGINYTIIRPGGLRNDPPSGNIVMEPEDTLYEGYISRDQVAEVVVEAFFCPESSYKVVEIVARTEAPKRSIADLFSLIKRR